MMISQTFRSTLPLVASAIVGLTLMSSPSSAQTPARVRGTVESLAGQTLAVKSRDGSTEQIKLAENVRVVSVIKASISDIKPGTFIGTASVAKDGGSRALEVVIFPEAMRGTGEGDYPWDLQPHSTMTNGTVGSSVKGVDGPTITVAYKGGDRKVTVGPDTPIVTFGPASTSDLQPGAKVFTNAKKAADGSLSAAAVTVGKDGIAPPM